MWGQGLADVWEWGQARCLGTSCRGLVTEAGRQPGAAEAGVGDAMGGVQDLHLGAAAPAWTCTALSLLRGTPHHCPATPPPPVPPP